MHTYEQSTADTALSASVSTMNACHMYWNTRSFMGNLSDGESLYTARSIAYRYCKAAFSKAALSDLRRPSPQIINL